MMDGYDIRVFVGKYEDPHTRFDFANKRDNGRSYLVAIDKRTLKIIASLDSQGNEEEHD